MGTNDGSISFGKGRKVDFTGFNGIKKEDFNVEGNEKKKKLVDAIFNRYNVDGASGDDILTEEELKNIKSDVTQIASGGKKDRLGKGEAQKFLQKLGFADGEYSRDELLEILNKINADEDSVELAKTNKDGTTSVQYKPDGNKTTKMEVYSPKHILVCDGEIKDDKPQRFTEYREDGKTKSKEILYDNANESELYTKYAEDGITAEQRFRIKGSIREDLDPANGDRVIKRTTNKGQGNVQVDEYEYSENSVTKTTTKPDGTKVKTTTSDGGMKYVSNIDANNNETLREAFSDNTKVWSSKYEYNDNGRTVNTEYYSVDDGSITGRTKETQDKDNKTQTKVNVDENGNTQEYKHIVDKENDTWYGIVQAKYGITDHKTTMAIVHRLKANANVALSAKTIPDEITLPATVKVGNKDYSLINIDQTVSNIHNVPAQIKVPADIPADKLPKPLPATELKIEIPKITIPAKPTDLTSTEMPPATAEFPADQSKTIDFAKYQFPVVKENAGKLVKQQNGQFYQYDERGRVTFVYADEQSRNNGNYSAAINYNGTDTEINDIEIMQYDNKGHRSAKLTYFADNSSLWFTTLADLGDNKYRRTEYEIDSQGNSKIYKIYIDEYNSNNQLVKKTYYGKDGKLDQVRNYLYENNIFNGCEMSYWTGDNEYRTSLMQGIEMYHLGNSTDLYSYDKKGKFTESTQYVYNDQGYRIKYNTYNASGKLDYASSDDYDADGNNIRTVLYKKDGSVEQFEDFEYRSDGRYTRSNIYTPQGKYYYHKEYRYGADGQERKLEYDAQGRLIK